MFKQFAVAATLAFVAASSFAAPTAYYGGSAKFDDLGGSQVGAGAFVGYGFNTSVAVELGYRELGKFDLFGADVPIHQTQVSVVGSLPLNAQFDIYGRVGYNALRGSADHNYGHYTVTGDTRLIGIGVAARFAPNLTGRVELQGMAKGATYVGVGVVYQF
jgi:hypothetical protein